MDQMVSEERAVSMKSPDSGAGPLDFGRDKPVLDARDGADEVRVQPGGGECSIPAKISGQIGNVG